MSWPVSIWRARTSPGPLARSRMRFGPSPCILRPIALTLSTMSVMSSSTPGSDENSCKTPSICIEVTAAPCSEDSSTRLSALPRVRPKPRSSGSATTVATRSASPPGSTASCFGLIRVCQFFCSTTFASVDKARTRSANREPAHRPARKLVRPRAGRAGAHASHAAALGRAAAVVRDRRYVADRGDRKADRLQRPEGRFAPRTRALDLDVEGAHAVLHGLLAGILGGDLRGVGGRFARALEALAARGRPGNRVALGIGDRDHRVVEARADMRGARGNVLALASPQTRCCRAFCHLALPPLRSPKGERLFLLARDRARRTLAGAGVGVGALAAHRQPLPMPQAAIAAQIHQPLDVHRDLPAQIALDRELAVDQLAHP